MEHSHWALDALLRWPTVLLCGTYCQVISEGQPPSKKYSVLKYQPGGGLNTNGMKKVQHSINLMGIGTHFDKPGSGWSKANHFSAAHDGEFTP